MFGFAFALVPFYNQICVALGINNVEQPAEAVNTQVDRSRTVTIELDSNAHNLPWRFRPLVSEVKVHPGELTTIEYEIVNVRGAAVTGQAVPSYGPANAGEYFKKIECF
jgi:cytochrome c oxidase assembly protein subunit 11